MENRTVTETRCPCCMEIHDTQHVSVRESNIFKEVPVEYMAEYNYCERADEMFADEKQISLNDINMKNAYRKKMGLLTSYQIAAIREQYDISQADLCLLLGWGGKTITRYESHQVQDRAHDTILRKLSSDPAWFLQLLTEKRTCMPPRSYGDCKEAGCRLYKTRHDSYLQETILSSYAGLQNDTEVTGNKSLSLEVVIDMVNYYANAATMKFLFVVKLMKLLWYADALSFKRRGYSISGLVYRALPMGAVPIGYKSILELSGIQYEEIEMGDGIGYHFFATEHREYPRLSYADREILDVVIERFDDATKDGIVEAMHQEEAYKEASLRDVIPFKRTLQLSLS